MSNPKIKRKWHKRHPAVAGFVTRVAVTTIGAWIAIGVLGLMGKLP